ncbi:MAG: ABC transporter permease [Balneolaceae bacterium]|jgi:ABC-2 type transport system permease protein|nr:ABC transporter permease [Balneolaceae bacterium]
MINFSKIWLIIKREYKTRVQTKSFLLSTFLTPLLILGFMGFVIFMTVSDNEAPKQVIVIDETGRMLYPLTQLNATRYLPIKADQSIEQIRNLIMEDELDGYVFFDQTFLSEGTPATFVHNGSGGITFFESLRSDVRDVTRQIRLKDNDVSDAVIAIFEERPALENRRLNEAGVDEQSNAFLSSIGGILIGVFIFIGLFGYGAILMRSVIEEKTSRIVEIITSSVKPIELMLGKLLGVCLVALTQFSLWIATYAGVTILAAPVAQFFINQRMGDFQNSLNAVDATGTAANMPSDIDLSFLEQFSIDPLFVLYFFVFFVLGFLMYSSIFAAIGAAVDSEQDSQQFMTPVMLPIFLGYILNFRIAEAPDSTFAIVASLFPLTSPINMVTRMLVSNVPFWEVLLSILLLILSLIGMLLLAARIYRTGILMYGKKPTFKELYKWIRQA